MRYLSLTVIALLIACYVQGQTSPHGTAFKIDCAQCHTSKNWKVNPIEAKFNHDNTSFKLAGQHTIVNCLDCHKSLNFKDGRRNCLDCHTDVHNLTLGKVCEKCHTPTTWIVSDGTKMHQQTRFPLLGAHRTVSCTDCHKSAAVYQFEVLGIECVNCHREDFLNTTSPNHVTGRYSTDCLECHNENTTSWQTKLVNHDLFPLTGGHNVGCGLCHTSTHYAKIPAECIACHQSQYDRAPNHKKVNFPVDCTKCHSRNNWIENSFNHASTSFPLTGKHVAAKCTDCHVSTLAGTPAVCSSCHLPVYNASQIPAHLTAGIPKDCAVCHTTGAWKPSTFNHTASGYELKGSHKTLVQCSLCHKGNVTSAPQTCIGCHQTKYDSAPDHKSQGYPVDCTNCHTQNNWLENSFNHAATNFPLTGAHTAVLCSKCHTSVYKGTSSACLSCHLPVYTSSQLPGHVAAGIPRECSTCHTTIVWKPSSFNHTTTGYELLGAHKTIVQCSLCHKGNVTSAPQTCIACHQVQYDGAPGHKQNNYATDCTKCHTQNNWLATSFDHSTTSFPLTGAHTNVLCSTCHVNGYVNTPTACQSCHLPVYTSSQLPGHVAAGIPKECATCHTTSAWKPSSFSHTATGYALRGAHKNIIQCSDCHKGSVTTTLQTCISCHQSRYDTAPNHNSQGYPTDCTVCHTQNNWLENSFNHASTSFPLTGAHTTVLCAKCHTAGFKGTPTACYSCHAAKYNASTNPNHVSIKFPTNCESCHTTGAWVPSTFNHDAQYFPINSGKHSGKWTLCSECHYVATNYATFSCILCHEHSSKASVDGHHTGVSNYSYTGISCFKCHPSGRVG